MTGNFRRAFGVSRWRTIMIQVLMSIHTYIHTGVEPSCRLVQTVQLPYHVKAIPLQAWTGPGGSRSLRLSDFKKIGTWRW
jgi:hypothetical protein